MPRIHSPQELTTGARIRLAPEAARHVQVLRLQPKDPLTLFDGSGGEYEATVEHMGRSDVEVLVGPHHAVEREASREVHLAMGMPANERMDWLIEKATELGASSVQPLLSERSVLRPSGERAVKKRAHWQGIAQAACAQCGRNRIPVVHDILALPSWLAAAPTANRLLLSLQGDSLPLSQYLADLPPGPVVFLSGPEGGLSAGEEEAARAQGFTAVGLGPRILRAETAPLAALIALTLGS